MKTFKSVLFSLSVITATLFSTPAFAGDIIINRHAQVRAELTKLIQNPDLKGHGIMEADLYIQFKVEENGEIILTAVNTDQEYLLDFIKEKVHHQKLDLVDVPPNSMYNLRIKFQLQ